MADPEPVYPPTIDCWVIDPVGDALLPLVARRTGEQDEYGCEQYEVQTREGGPIPYSAADFRDGVVGLRIAVMPSRSAFSYSFERAEP